jgi:hypothetical protein
MFTAPAGAASLLASDSAEFVAMAAQIAAAHAQMEGIDIFIIIEALFPAEALSLRGCAQRAASLTVTRSLCSITYSWRWLRMLSGGYG